MANAASREVVVILEGGSDQRFWRRWLHRSANIVAAGGKRTVLDAISLIDAGAARRAFGMVDDDGDSVLGIDNRSQNLIVTAERDLEAALVRSPAFDVMVDDIIDRQRVLVAIAPSSDLREFLVQNARPWGAVQLFCRAQVPPIPFARVHPARICNQHQWACTAAEAVSAFVSSHSGVSESAVEAFVARLAAVDAWLVVRGKDLLQLLSIGLKWHLGAGDYSRDRLLELLRVAMPAAHVSGMDSCRRIREWSQRNGSLRVLLSDEVSR